MRQLILVLLIAVSGFVADTSTPALAQYTIFDFFEQDYYRPPPRRSYRYNAPDRWQRRYDRQQYRRRAPVMRKEVPSVSVRQAELPKDANAKTILVIGDDVADGLAKGLREAFAQDSNALVQSAFINGASLVKKTDDKDLVKLTREKIESLNPAAVIIMIGNNDHEAFVSQDKAVAFRSNNWRSLYLQQLDDLAQALKTRPMPIYWVGLPSTQNKNLSSDMAYLNDVYREKAMMIGAKFVDVWEGFVDENGQYMTIGPDVNGYKRRLRLRDGKTLTPAGYRKLAFYAETRLRRDILFKVRDPAEGRIAAAKSSEGLHDPLVPNSYVGPVLSLTPALPEQNTSLMGVVTKENAADTTGSIAAVAAAKPGRSDDFTWPLDQRARPPAEKPRTVAPQRQNR